MTEDFSRLLQQTEDKWLEVLYRQVKETFSEDPLPSHNEQHHLRVWNYTKELLSELSVRGSLIDQVSLEEIIIAVFFHDTGMSINRDSDHGKESRRLCEEWLLRQNIPLERYSSKMFDAIEHHDNKSYIFPGALTSGMEVNLLSVLNVCDDMDAFSYCGIYRYSEIYLLRGIALEELGQQVISNASRRFGNFMANCMQLPVMIKTHTPRYDVLESFFRQYNAQLRKDPTGKNIEHGPVHIVKFFYRQILGGVNSVESLCSSAINKNEGMYEKTFFENLRREWCNPSPALPKGEGVGPGYITANPQTYPKGEGVSPGYITTDPQSYKLIKEFRVEIKKNPTKAESVLWEFLRKKKTGHNIRRQHIIGEYIADFVCLPMKVVIEVDGKIHEINKEADEIRTSRLNELGYKVIRFTNDEVLEFPSKVAGKIKEYLNNPAN
jgi:very-short-patch-repair endonuclease